MSWLLLGFIIFLRNSGIPVSRNSESSDFSEYSEYSDYSDSSETPPKRALPLPSKRQDIDFGPGTKAEGEHTANAGRDKQLLRTLAIETAPL